MNFDLTIDLIRAIMALVAGVILGTCYFYALWWTSRRIVAVKRAGLFFVGSFFVRMGFLIVGLYFVTRGRPIDTLISVAGLMIGRRLVMHRANRVED